MTKNRITISNTAAEFLQEGRGDLLIGNGFGIFLILIIFMTCLFVYPLYTTYQALNTEARQLVSVVEDSGRVGDEVEDVRSILETTSGVVPDAVEWSATWHNAGEQTIQLGSMFTVTLRKQYTIPIFMPVWSDTPLGVPIELTATATGISEEYYKP